MAYIFRKLIFSKFFGFKKFRKKFKKQFFEFEKIDEIFLNPIFQKKIEKDNVYV
jgi:hypothetical protein